MTNFSKFNDAINLLSSSEQASSHLGIEMFFVNILITDTIQFLMNFNK